MYDTVWNCTRHQIVKRTLLGSVPPRLIVLHFTFHSHGPLKPITPSLLLYEPNFAAFRNPERAGERTSLTDRSRHRASVNTTLPIKPTGTVRLYSSHINKGRGRQRRVSFPSQYPNSQKDQCT